uniref:BACK domain-containing protein n=1 Tax=Aegilops tauschii subsp. strangulata TaxID=200361 RepID=A0A453LLT5_AEGTS
MFHFNGSRPDRGSQEIPCRKVHGIPVDRVSDPIYIAIGLRDLSFFPLLGSMWTLLSSNHMVLLHCRFQDELMRMPPAGIEAILSRNDFGVASEVAVYDFVLRWASSPCPNSEERMDISSSRLLPLVRLRITNADFYSCHTVNWAVKREQCRSLPTLGPIFSWEEYVFALSVHWVGHLGLYIEMEENKGPTRTVHFEFQAKTKPLLQFVTWHKGTFAAGCEGAVCSMELLGIPWSGFIADDSPFFIDDMLHLRVKLKIMQEPQ